MTAPGPLVVSVVELVRRPANRARVQRRAPVGELRVVDSRVPDTGEVDVDVELESLSDGVMVTGHLRAPWEGVCRRCLTPVGGTLDVDVRELFQERPTSDEVYPFDGEHLDLEPMVREALTLELPLAPLCRDECAGLCPVCGSNRNEVACDCDTTTTDPRWAALDALREQPDA